MIAPEDDELVSVPVFKRPTIPPTSLPPVTTTLETATSIKFLALLVELTKPTTPPTLLLPELESEP